MDRPLTAREKIQLAYEIAFFPPRTHQLWNTIRHQRPGDPALIVELLKTALSLQLALPESGYASQRALKRLANYQADARAFGTVTFLKNILRHLGKTEEIPTGVVPPHLVRDIGLPPFCRVSMIPGFNDSDDAGGGSSNPFARSTTNTTRSQSTTK